MSVLIENILYKYLYKIIVKDIRIAKQLLQ